MFFTIFNPLTLQYRCKDVRQCRGATLTISAVTKKSSTIVTRLIPHSKSLKIKPFQALFLVQYLDFFVFIAEKPLLLTN